MSADQSWDTRVLFECPVCGSVKDIADEHTDELYDYRMCWNSGAHRALEGVAPADRATPRRMHRTLVRREPWR